MSKVLRVALPVILAGVFALALGTTPAQATCPFDALITQGVLGGNIDPVSCGVNNASIFWLIGHGDPAIGVGIDNGISPGFMNAYPDGSGEYYWQANWGNSGVDNCVTDILQGPDNVGPIAIEINNGAGEGSVGHSASYVVLSTDLDETYQFFNLDIITTSTVMCVPKPAPQIDGIVPNGTGFDVTMHWAPATNLLDDCATNPAILAPDCTGGTRALQIGWGVYSKSAECSIGTLSGDKSGWTKVATLPVSANAGTTVNLPAPATGQCRFVALNPIWDSNMEGQFLSAQAGPIGGGTDSDGDGILDSTDNCPNAYNPGQADGDGDHVGDVCDNCPAASNTDQADGDSDGIGDVCDFCPTDPTNDVDNDGVCGQSDNCPSVANADQLDTDGDGIGDVCDTCPLDPLNDADGDGFCANVDNCPTIANANQLDTDGDGKGDVCDPCRYENVDDADGDGVCACDVALSNAGVCGTYPNITDGNGNAADNCPKVANAAQTPSGIGDGLGAACEDTFGVVELQSTKGWGSCTIRFKTVNEWNCPKFRATVNGNDAGLSFNCSQCTNGQGQKATYYGGDLGAPIAKCKGANNVRAVAVRSNPSSCAGFVVPTQATLVNVTALGARVR